MQRVSIQWLAVLVMLITPTLLILNSLTRSDESDENALYRGLVPTQTDTLSQVKPDRVLHFPDDHQPHPNYAIEWWYFTANLSSNNQKYGLQYTLFRFNRGNKYASNWANGQMYMAHASLHTPDKHYFSERFARGGQQHVGVTSSPFSFRMDEWLWEAKGNDLLPATLSLNLVSASSSSSLSDETINKLMVDLDLTGSGPLILQGEAGFSQKSSLGTHASYYYSQPFILADGVITEHIGSKKYQKVVSGKGWFDHEWTSQLLDQQTLGWDWFSIHLDGGEKLMAFRMRLKDSQHYVTGTIIGADGASKTLPNGAIKITPLAYEQDVESGKKYPTQWSLDIAKNGIEITISPQKQKQWNSGRFEYYEGAIKVSGTHTGEGFMELTGY